MVMCRKQLNTAGELELTLYINCTITICIENILGRQVAKTLNVMFVR